MLLSKLHTVFVSVQECLTSTHMIHPSFPFLSWPRQRVSSGFKDTQKALLLCDLWSLHKSCHKTCADIFPLVKCMPFKNKKKKILKMMQHNHPFFVHQVRDNHHQFPTSSCIIAHFPQSELIWKHLVHISNLYADSFFSPSRATFLSKHII